MKTLLYNPLFINPQAYYVFPRLTSYLQPDTESTLEPANYIGVIEVKVIAHGDTTLKRTYTNTDSIDLSEFNNAWVRISLFTKAGSCVLGEWKIGDNAYANMVEFQPIINQSIGIESIKYYYLSEDANEWVDLQLGDYVPIGTEVSITVTLKNNHELSNVVSEAFTDIKVEPTDKENTYNVLGYITKTTPQNITFNIDSYILFEDIVQPYPYIIELTDTNTQKKYTYGDKLKVDSDVSIKIVNLLPDMYDWNGRLLLNGVAISSTYVYVKSRMVFSFSKPFIYRFDDNEPKCILSPRILKMPNSSYKYLGYIPDISGHGNHGVIYNSAYVEGSGANEDGSYQLDGVDDFVTIPTLSSGGNQVLMKVNQSNLDACLYSQVSQGVSQDRLITSLPTSLAYQGKYEISNWNKVYIDGIENNNITNENLYNKNHIITGVSRSAVETVSPVIGALRANGTVAVFAKMALYDFMLFDEISTEDKIKELNEYVGIEAKVELPPYYWDTHGKTNLDEDKDYIANLGTVEDVIEVSQPAIFAENWYDNYESFGAGSPIINQTDYSIEVSPTHMDNNFMMMLDVRCDTPLPAFRAKFTRTSNVDVRYAEIRYMYYVNGEWTYIDIFGEDNSAESVILDIPASEKSSILGGNVDNFPNILIEVLPTEISTLYGLSNKNFAYDKMSGYGGYEFAKFDNTSEWIYTNNSDTIEVVNRDGYSVVLRKVGNGANYWHFRNTVIKSLGQDIRIGIYANNSVQIVWQLKYKLEGDTDYNTLAIASPTIEGNINTYVTLPYKTEQEIADLNAIDTYYSIYFIPIDLDINEEVTIEMLPLYPNGLVYDGVTDYSYNANIPALTDYAYVFKRELLDASANTCTMYKGVLTEGSRTAFVSDYDKNTEIGGRSFGNYIAASSLRTNKIIYGTKTSVNGDSIVPGNNVDALGLVLGKYYDNSYKKLVFYKLILYPKTIPLLQINYLKNLMERDEIIDLNNPIFVQE